MENSILITDKGVFELEDGAICKKTDDPLTKIESLETRVEGDKVIIRITASMQPLVIFPDKIRRPI